VSSRRSWRCCSYCRGCGAKNVDSRSFNQQRRSQCTPTEAQIAMRQGPLLVSRDPDRATTACVGETALSYGSAPDVLAHNPRYDRHGVRTETKAFVEAADDARFAGQARSQPLCGRHAIPQTGDWCGSAEARGSRQALPAVMGRGRDTTA
jgi:hypothetical protein